MSFQINVFEMKMRTQIENNLLKQINDDLKKNVNEIEFIHKNYFYDNLLNNFENINNKFLNLNVLINKKIETETETKTETKTKFNHDNNDVDNNIDNDELIKITTFTIIDKIIKHSSQLYWIFQYFYLKKKDFMGMNMTGLINGKMETGLNFRNSITKISIKDFFKQIYNNIENDLDNNISVSDINDDDIKDWCVYKIKSNNFDFSFFPHKDNFDNLSEYGDFYLVSNMKLKKYNIFVEKNQNKITK